MKAPFKFSVSFKRLFIFILPLILSSCQPCNYYNVPINVGQGGRTVALDKHPSNDRILWAATETGGVFKTTNGGDLWQHMDNLPNFQCFDIKVAPLNPDVVIVSTLIGSNVRNDGGIWVSSNSGVNWVQPPTALPRYSTGSPPVLIPARFNSYGICFKPESNIVYAGTDSGYAVSNDMGVNWRYYNHNPGNKNPVYSIFILRSGKTFLYSNDGVWISDDGLTGWRHNSFLTGGWQIKGNFAVSPLNDNHIFFSNSFTDIHDTANGFPKHLFHSTDGGDNWRPLNSYFGWYNGRMPYIKVVRSTSGRDDEIDLYYSNMSLVAKKTLRFTGSDYDTNGTWNEIPFAHPDPADLVFASDGRTPLYAANDGGVEKTTNGGANWNIISRPNNFFNALQVFNVKGVFYTGSPLRIDLYFGTQDNYFWSSGDTGRTWPYATGAEGFGIQGPVQFNTSSDSSIIYFNIGGCPWCISDPHYLNPRDLSKPTEFPAQIPLYINGRLFINLAKSSDTTLITNLYSTTNKGISWESTGLNLNFPAAGFSVSSGTSGNPSILVPFIAEGTFGPTGIYGIMRYDNLFDATADNEIKRRLPLPENCKIGTVATMWPWYPSPGIDPSNPDFMIIADIVNNRIWKTTNFGEDWEADDNLMRLVTDDGKYYLGYQWYYPQVRTVDFDPRNTNHIAIGTYQAGVIYSRNKGRTWIKLPGSEDIPFITSFFFIDDTTAVASTYGRGLVKVYLRETPISGNYKNDARVYQTFQNQEKKPKWVKGVKLPVDNPNINAPAVFMQSAIAGSSVINIFQGKANFVKGKNWQKDKEISIKLDGKEIVKNVKTDAFGNFTIQIPPLFEPKLYLLNIVQFDSFQKKLESTLAIKVSIGEEKIKK